MKKTIFTLLALGLFTQTTQAQSLNCSSENTVAVDKYGTCRIYSNPCQVPSEWRVLPVDSCENVKSATGKTTDTVADRRIEMIHQAKKRRAEANNKDLSIQNSYNKIGKALYTRGRNQNNETIKTEVAQSTPRTFRNSLGSFQLRQRAYKEQREQTNKETVAEYEKQGLRRPAIRSNVEATRDGSLKNEPNYLQRQAQRYTKDVNTLGKRSPHWTSVQQKAEDKKERKTHVPRKITLQKTFRGYENERRNASLDNMTNRNE